MKLLLQLLTFVFVTLYSTTVINGQYALLNYYGGEDLSCNGEIISTTYNREGTCLDGTEYVCVGNTVQTNFYTYQNCTGGIFQQWTQQQGECQGSLEISCVDNYQFNSDSIITVISDSCDNWKGTAKSILSRPANKCIVDPTSKAISFACSSETNTLTTTTYNSTTDCTGQSNNITLHLPPCNPELNYFYTYICNQ